MTRTAAATHIANRFDAFHDAPIRHAMSGRLPSAPAEGDVGHGPDTDDATIEGNRLAVLAAAGIAIDDLVISRQTHGNTVAVVSADDRGRGLYPRFDGFPATDAMVTDDPTVALGIIVADCVPILLYDRRRHVLGIAHAGWRGTVGMIAAATVQTMNRAFGSEPADIAAGIGPSIGPCCYEVGSEVIDAWASATVGGGDRAVIVRESGYHFDLWAANRSVLVQAGVPDRRIADSAICVRCEHERFFSHRASRQVAAATGRNMMVAQLLPT